MMTFIILPNYNINIGKLLQKRKIMLIIVLLIYTFSSIWFLARFLVTTAFSDLILSDM